EGAPSVLRSPGVLMISRPASGSRSAQGPIPDYLLQLPETFPRAPVVTRPPLLPFGQLGWPDFERLCLAVARSVDAVHVEAAYVIGPRLYGRSGQKQRGIDIYADLPDGTRTVYQARRIKSVTA